MVKRRAEKGREGERRERKGKGEGTGRDGPPNANSWIRPCIQSCCHCLSVCVRARVPRNNSDKLYVCRFLATGDSYNTIANSYRVGISTVSGIIYETCDAIWRSLQPVYMPCPTKEDWVRVAADFHTKWNFPNCVGAVDGKHVVIKCPAKSGSMYFNYKGTFSVVLLAVVDANYSFLIVDVGGYGKQSDGGTLATSEFGARLNNDKLDLPEAKPPPGSHTTLPHVFVADEAFPLTTHMMRPYAAKKTGPAERIYNYRLSRARRIVENAFGILAARFRVFHRTMDQRPQTVDRIIQATCVLHNMLLKRRNSTGCSATSEDQEEVSCSDDSACALQPLQPLQRNRATHEAFNVRDQFRDYFSSPQGLVSWQANV